MLAYKYNSRLIRPYFTVQITIYYVHLLKSCHVSITIIVCLWSRAKFDGRRLQSIAIDWVLLHSTFSVNVLSQTEYSSSFLAYPLLTRFCCFQFCVLICASIRPIQHIHRIHVCECISIVCIHINCCFRPSVSVRAIGERKNANVYNHDEHRQFERTRWHVT